MRKLRHVRQFCYFLLTGIIFLSLLQSLNKKGETDYSSLTDDQINELVKEADADMAERRARVKMVCSKYNLGDYEKKGDSRDEQLFQHPPIPKDRVFFIDDVHKMTYCPIYKAASTTWLHQMMLLAGISEQAILNETKARSIYPEPHLNDVEKALRTTLKFIIVRHPFERLVSAFRDKLENKSARQMNGNQHFYAKLFAPKIIAKSRNSTSGSPEPTFQEFVAYLLKEKAEELDDHWIPNYLFCTPCIIDYDIIAHVETLFRDQLYVIKKVKLEGKIWPIWRHITKGQSSAGEIAKSYFSQLTQSDVQQLYKMYRLDFELFGYNHSEYLNFARN
ncbi:carbohydrate sulfotransferase 11-like [Neocloeon triangulifer]|uniref:carbohydrate sulfotransferase 11-like n=1 Tax=Neocloeon triangulifer TaxID=2078957 RepID=UPI00286F2CC2|nr:carbohydrate sulfotransferase 11-like [Neocloeon triangulifer]